MVNVVNQHINVKDESVYGTAVAADKSIVFNTESITGDYSNVIMSGGLKANEYLVNAKRVARNPKGAAGDLELEVDNMGCGFWFKHMFGQASTGSTTLGVTTHTFNLGDTAGKSFTLQKNMSGSDQERYVKTYQGGKVLEWELSNAVDEFLMLKLGLDFQKETIGAGSGPLASQAANFGDSDKVKTFKFYEAVINIGGVQGNVTSFSLKGTKTVKADRYFLGSHLKKEPVQDGHDELTLELSCEFESLEHELRVASAVESGAQASVTATWTATEPEAGGGLSSLTVTIPVVSFTEAGAPIDGVKLIEQSVKGNVLWPGSGQGTSPVTAVLLTPEATV